ncbi:MAG TPA: acyltransferase [Thiobacillaceae bacterium]|nr:acyltransferase [Thiobacillaceae bacterium]
MNSGPVRRASGKMASIEGARGIAAILVVLMHCTHLMRVEQFSGHVGLGGIFDFGYVGVDFFFVLSGFIITFVHHPDLGRWQSLPVYLWRRLTRIYPIYWISLGIYIAVALLGRLALGKPPALDMGWSDFPATVLLAMTGEPKYVGVAWSLQYEIVFYLAFCPLILSARLGFTLFAVWALAILLALAGGFDPGRAGFLFNGHCLEFLMGVGIGLAARRLRHRPAWAGMLPLALGAFVLAVVYEMLLSPARHGADGRILLGAASAAILWCLIRLETGGGIRTPAWLGALGSVSYSIYLTHVVFINATFSVLNLAHLYHALPDWAVFLIGLAGGLAGAGIVGYFLELPLVRRLKHLVKSPRPGHAAGRG